MTQLPIYQVDAFAETLFTGNPAAVCPLESWLPDRTLQLIARENNLSETAFFTPEGSGFRLRWFTPVAEVDLCGHATLAAAAVVFKLDPHRSRVSFETRSGTLGASRVGTEGPSDRAVTIQLSFPRIERNLIEKKPNAPEREPAEAALGIRAQEAWTTGGESDLVLLLADEDEVRSIAPDFRALARLSARGVAITAPGQAEAIDYVCRFFAPKHNVDEDPATGSAQCHLAPYWAERLGKNHLESRQLSQRVGAFTLEVSAERIALTGRAHRYLEGTIWVPNR